MASKEVMAITPEDIHAHIALSQSAAETLKWMLENAGRIDEGDTLAVQEFVALRNAHASAIRECWELKAWCEKAADSIKTVTKLTMNTGSEEELPEGFSWNRQAFTYEFAEGAGHIVARDLIDKGLVTVEQILDAVTPSALAKIAGLKTEKIAKQYGDDVVIQNAKDRNLKVK